MRSRREKPVVPRTIRLGVTSRQPGRPDRTVRRSARGRRPSESGNSKPPQRRSKRGQRTRRSIASATTPQMTSYKQSKMPTGTRGVLVKSAKSVSMSSVYARSRKNASSGSIRRNNDARTASGKPKKRRSKNVKPRSAP